MSHYFIGIKVHSEISEKLMNWQSILRETMNYKDWTAKADLHVTLKFLGSCSDERIERYVQRLKNESWPSEYSLTVGPAGCFGDQERPRVFHAQVEKAPSLLETKEKVDGIGEKLGFQKEKREFNPHITLAKKQAEGVSPLMEASEASTLFETYEMVVNEFSIFRIHPGKHPKYETVATIKGGQKI
ncbi:RNA 2',3'-cyclic phosphodiesterase [Halobacillus trueperi]|uniref:RNA 2',3'-cyclic phosphodiesterase n=2 Tax=Halobacillus TaxID=45667 RepID=A0A1H0DUZ5_HALAD|nr:MULTISPECIES: RNA 2',3'-cyclic phosphodiesterase [Halobacillus]RDY70942.1 RNA 2',3'-cyclic phosphodiesterase [Halobacillus trueperi]SDN74024.1 2'-5' RNA ligase [Halobacillus aidingensis]